jgi:hypothetical protein
MTVPENPEIEEMGIYFKYSTKDGRGKGHWLHFFPKEDWEKIFTDLKNAPEEPILKLVVIDPRKKTRKRKK